MRKILLCTVAALTVGVPLLQPALGAGAKKKPAKCAHYKEKAGCALTADNGYAYVKGGSFRTRLSVLVQAIGAKPGGHASGAGLFVNGGLPCVQSRTSRHAPKVAGRLVIGKTQKISGTATVNTGTGTATQTTVGTVKLTTAKTASLKLHITFKTDAAVTCDQKVSFTLKRFKQTTG